MESAFGVELGPYIPHNAYLMTTSWEVAQRVAGLEGVDWVGAWQDEFKMQVDEEEEEEEQFEKGRMMVELAPSKRWTPQEGTTVH